MKIVLILIALAANGDREVIRQYPPNMSICIDARRIMMDSHPEINAPGSGITLHCKLEYTGQPL